MGPPNRDLEEALCWSYLRRERREPLDGSRALGLSPEKASRALPIDSGIVNVHSEYAYHRRCGMKGTRLVVTLLVLLAFLCAAAWLLLHDTRRPTDRPVASRRPQLDASAVPVTSSRRPGHEAQSLDGSEQAMPSNDLGLIQVIGMAVDPWGESVSGITIEIRDASKDDSCILADVTTNEAGEFSAEVPLTAEAVVLRASGDGVETTEGEQSRSSSRAGQWVLPSLVVKRRIRLPLELNVGQDAMTAFRRTGVIGVSATAEMLESVTSTEEVYSTLASALFDFGTAEQRKQELWIDRPGPVTVTWRILRLRDMPSIITRENLPRSYREFPVSRCSVSSADLVAGKVVSQSGQALAGAIISLAVDGDLRPQNLSTDAQSRFLLYLGRGTCATMHADYGPKSSSPRVRACAGNSLEVVLAVDTSNKISIQAVGPDGQPLIRYAISRQNSGLRPSKGVRAFDCPDGIMITKFSLIPRGTRVFVSSTDYGELSFTAEDNMTPRELPYTVRLDGSQQRGQVAVRVDASLRSPIVTLTLQKTDEQLSGKSIPIKYWSFRPRDGNEWILSDIDYGAYAYELTDNSGQMLANGDLVVRASSVELSLIGQD